MKEKLSIKDGIYIFNFLLPNIAFLIIPSSYSITPSLTLIGKSIVFILYLIPTVLFIRYIRKKFNKFKISDFRFKELKKVIESCILFLFSISIGIYLLFNKFYYIGVPIIFMAIELIPCIILELREYSEEALLLDTMFKEQSISLEELEKYDKWKGFMPSTMETFFLSGVIIVPLCLPQLYFNLIPNTIYPYLIYCILFILLFIRGIPYLQILDCKSNSFIKTKGICIDHVGAGRGTAGHYVVKIIGVDMTISVRTEKEIFTNKEVVTVIFGLHSKQVIKAY